MSPFLSRWKLAFLWFQLIFSIWQFFRVAKFCRMPYGILSSFWNKGRFKGTWFRKRKLLVFYDRPSHEIDTSIRQKSTSQLKASVSYESKNVHGRGSIFFDISFEIRGVKYRYWANNHDRTKLVHFLSYITDCIPVHEYTNLTSYSKFANALSIEDCLSRIDMRGHLEYKHVNCFIDQSSRDYINQDFFRVLSIFPLALTARGYENGGIVLSLVLIIFDLLSYPLNVIWKSFKHRFMFYTKVFVSFLFKKNARYRDWWFNLLSSASMNFMYCDESMKKVYCRDVKRIWFYGITSELEVFEHERPIAIFPIQEKFNKTIDLNLYKISVDFELGGGTFDDECYLMTMKCYFEGECVYEESNDEYYYREACKVVNFLDFLENTQLLPVTHIGDKTLHCMPIMDIFKDSQFGKGVIFNVKNGVPKRYWICDPLLIDRIV